MGFLSFAFFPGVSQTDPNIGAYLYTDFGLTIYDFLVLYPMKTFVWRYSTSEVLLPFFRSNVCSSKYHLDIGCGTGFFLERGHINPDTKVTLYNLNSNCLERSTSRLGRPTKTRCL